MRICQFAACATVLAVVLQVQGRPQRRSPRRIQDYEEDDGQGWPRVELGRVKPCKTQTCNAAPTITETICTTATDMKVIWTTETSTKTIIEDVWVTEYGEVALETLQVPDGNQGEPPLRPETIATAAPTGSPTPIYPLHTKAAPPGDLQSGWPSVSRAATPDKRPSSSDEDLVETREGLPPPEQPSKTASISSPSEQAPAEPSGGGELVDLSDGIAEGTPQAEHSDAVADFTDETEPSSPQQGASSSLSLPPDLISMTQKDLASDSTLGPTSSNMKAGLLSVVGTSSSMVDNPIASLSNLQSDKLGQDVPSTSEVLPKSSIATPASSLILPPSAAAMHPAGKKGINYNNAALLSQFAGAGAGQVGWAANWEQTMEGVPQGMHYYPMLWNVEQQRIDRWAATCEAAMARGDNVLLGFNEPQSDQCGRQACMTADVAAAAWRQHILPWKARGAFLVSPSITQGDVGARWLSDFLAQCPPAECMIDAISLHWYEGAHQIEYFKKYFTDAYNNPAFGKLPIYVTEFAPTSGTPEEKAAFVREAVQWMNQQDFVLGYALFWAEDATTNGVINEMGAAYAQAT